jgi:hypothetical protein
MKYIIFLGIAFLPIVLCLYNCQKECGSRVYELPIEYYGVKDTLDIGDTIHLKISIPDRLLAQGTDDWYEFDDYDFRIESVLSRLDTIMFDQLVGKDYFEWVTVVGRTLPTELPRLVPDYDGKQYLYEAYLVTKRGGLFELAISSFHNTRFPLPQPEGRCKKGGVNVTMKILNIVDSNFEFLQMSEVEGYRKTKKEVFEDYAGVCFYVR